MKFKDFLTKDYIGAGFVFITPDKKVLLLIKHNGKLTFPGGHRDEGEDSPVITARRECVEELGSMPAGELVGKLKLTKEGEKLPVYSFFMNVDSIFTPVLSWEHRGYKWVDYDKVKPSKLTTVFKSYWGLYKKFISSLP